MSLAKRFKDTRAAAGLSQAKLGELAGSTQDVVQKIENGKSLRPRNLDAFAAVLGVTSAWLQYGAEDATAIALNRDEQQMVLLYKQLTSEDKKAVRRILVGLSQHGKQNT